MSLSQICSKASFYSLSIAHKLTTVNCKKNSRVVADKFFSCNKPSEFRSEVQHFRDLLTPLSGNGVNDQCRDNLQNILLLLQSVQLVTENFYYLRVAQKTSLCGIYR